MRLISYMALMAGGLIAGQGSGNPGIPEDPWQVGVGILMMFVGIASLAVIDRHQQERIDEAESKHR